MIQLYSNIKLLRKSLKYSQEKLAELTGYTDRSSIAKIEQGLVDLPQSKIAEFAKALGVSCGELMGDVSAPPLRQDEEQFLDLYNQLDQEDRAELRGTAKGMLKSDKHKRKDTASKLA